MKKLVIASNNKGKIKEIKNMLLDLPFEVVSLQDMNIDIDVIEDGSTFEANSRKKAIEICEYLKSNGNNNFIVMADDSGLEVDYLNGEPGVYSARYAGEHGNDSENNKKLLSKLKGVSKDRRKARFVCQIALIDDREKYNTVQGFVEGYILETESGKDGFGYDPLFFYEPFNKTFAEATIEEKNSISHRGNALKKAKEVLKQYLL